MFGSRFLDSGSTDSEKVHRFGNSDSRVSFTLVQPTRHFCSLTPKMGVKWAYRRLRITQMADFNLLANYKHASNFNRAKPSAVVIVPPEMTSPATPAGSKLHQRVHFGSGSGRDFSTMVQRICRCFSVDVRAG